MPAPREGLPSGVVTLVFTDIEGSTRLLTELGLVLVESEQEPHRRAMARLEHALDAGRLRHEWEAGSRLGLDAMTALALAASTPG